MALREVEPSLLTKFQLIFKTTGSYLPPQRRPNRIFWIYMAYSLIPIKCGYSRRRRNDSLYETRVSQCVCVSLWSVLQSTALRRFPSSLTPTRSTSCANIFSWSVTLCTMHLANTLTYSLTHYRSSITSPKHYPRPLTSFPSYWSSFRTVVEPRVMPYSTCSNQPCLSVYRTVKVEVLGAATFSARSTDCLHLVALS